MPRNGITSTTFQNLIIGPGAVYKGFVNVSTLGTLLGATLGGNQITIERQYHAPELDGMLGPVKGTERIIKEIPKATVKLVEVTKENLQLVLPGVTTSAVGSTHTKIISGTNITTSHYSDIAIVGDISNKNNPVIFVIKNALATEPVEIPLGNGTDDVAYQVTFVGHYDSANPNNPPYEIYVPES